MTALLAPTAALRNARRDPRSGRTYAAMRSNSTLTTEHAPSPELPVQLSRRRTLRRAEEHGKASPAAVAGGAFPCQECG